uniref:Uncharacterized protein n=1 Tax=Rhizophora mucronata TaxID=61149 RepID=A0A2P2QQI9_RHIMU
MGHPDLSWVFVWLLGKWWNIAKKTKKGY